ncbi:MAG TPA: glutaredoxin family protein [Solirubrobacteraceae bacterium]|nr:glutaredoxin family protein [Solirubrobacteraceae bacterium]
MALVTVYTRDGCHLCEDALAALVRLRGELGFDLEALDIEADDALQKAYLERIPVIALNGEELYDFFLDEADLRRRLGAAGR